MSETPPEPSLFQNARKMGLKWELSIGTRVVSSRFL
jgi:hypothetical protein